MQQGEGSAMRKNAVMCGLAALSLTLIGSAAHAGDGVGGADAAVAEPPAGHITVDVVTVNGSGCPQGTATVTEKSDNTGFIVKYRDYVAEAGAGAGATDFRKNCQLSLLVHVPQGFTYAIAEADYAGNAH